MGDWFGGTPTITLTDSLSQLTFSQQVSNGAASQGLARFYTSEVGANDGSRTISGSTSLSSDVGGIKVWVMTNYRTAGFVDNTSGASNNTTNNLTANHTVNNDRSWVFAVAVEWQSLGAPTSTDVFEAFDDADLSLIAVRKSTITQTAGTVGVNLDAAAGTPLWTYSIISIREQDAAAGQTVAVNTVTETDTALAIGRIKTKAVGTVTETDTAVTISASKVRVIGTVVETDTAITLGIKKGVNTVVETDTALPITKPPKVIAVGTVVETDTAGTVGRIKTRAVGTVTETDTAIAITKKKVKAVGIVSETDTAIAISRKKTRAVGIVSETDTAIAIARSKTRLVGIVSETDTAIAIGRKKTKAIGIVPETDLALPITKPLKGANTVTETDTAMPLGRRKTKLVGIVSETDSAIAIGKMHKRLIGIVSETDLAIAVGRTKRKTVGIVLETDTALAFGKKKRFTIGTVVELDLAMPIFMPPTVFEGMRVDITSVGVLTRSPTGLGLRMVNAGVAIGHTIDGLGSPVPLVGIVGSAVQGVTGPALERVVTGVGVADVEGVGI
jgi:hypothetical protein